MGGCAGATAGGLKVSRILLVLKVLGRDFKRLAARRGVFAVRLGDRVIQENVIQNMLNLIYLALLVNFVASLLLASTGVDILTSISSVAATMFNVGPGLGHVGPVGHYGHLPGIAKWILSGCMIAGRLEFYAFFIVLTPVFWRR
jgi:trk system potassium uptake protein